MPLDWTEEELAQYKRDLARIDRLDARREMLEAIDEMIETINRYADDDTKALARALRRSIENA